MRGRSRSWGRVLPVVVALLVAMGVPLTAVTPAGADVGTWDAGPAMPLPVSSGATVTLADGRVLVAGGNARVGASINRTATSSVFDGTAWTATGSMTQARQLHAGVRLADGRVLVSGGAGTTTSAEVYNPATGTWSATGTMATGRFLHRLVLLADGRVLAVGDAFATAATAEIWNPTTGTWTTTAAPSTARGKVSVAERLADGRVLVAGGYGPGNVPLASAEIYDPTANTWTPAASMGTARAEATSTTLADGRVLATGGVTTGGGRTTAVDVFDPATGTWSPTGSMTHNRSAHLAVRTADGRVLVAFGDSTSPSTGHLTAEVWDPTTGAWAAAGTFAAGRFYGVHGALLSDGRVLAAGGWASDGSGPLASTVVWSATVAVPPPTVTLSSSPDPAVVGDTVTFTATVAGTAGTPTGTVTFLDGATTLGTATLDGAGRATLSTSALTEGTHSVTAAYSGDGTYEAITSAAVTQDVVTALPTTLDLSITVNPAPVHGQSIPLVARVYGLESAPTGAVEFRQGTTVLGTVPIAYGQAAISVQVFRGTNDFQATYLGDARNAPSSGSTSIAAGLAQTEVIIEQAPSTATWRQPIVVEAEVNSVSPGFGVPPGTARLLDGATVLATDELDPWGNAQFIVDDVAVGERTLTVEYLGTGDFFPSSASTTILVGKPPSMITLDVAAPGYVEAGLPLELTATATHIGWSQGPAVGLVSFYDDDVLVGQVPLDANGVARFDLVSMRLGLHGMRAELEPNATEVGSSSGRRDVNVTAIPSALTLTSDALEVPLGSAPVLTAEVTASRLSLDGTVAFTDGGTVLGTVALVDGTASIAPTGLTLGFHTIRAFFTPAPTSVHTTSFQDLVIQVVPATVATPIDCSVNDLIVSSMPASVRLGDVESDDTLALWSEPAEVTIGPDGLTVSTGAPGLYRDGDAATITLAPGTVISPWLAHLDPVGDGPAEAIGCRTFARTVLGLAATDADLAASDAYGRGDRYDSALVGRGLDADDAWDVDADGRTVRLALGADADLDQVRIITAGVKAGSSVTVSAPAVRVVGEPIAVTATVTPFSGSGATPTGSVRFVTDTGTSLGTVALVDGVATLSVSTWPLGVRHVHAEYRGDGAYATSSTATAATVTTSPAGTTTAVAVSADPALTTDVVTLTATVAAAAPGGGTPTGTVDFRKGSTIVASRSLSGGVATASVKLAAGSEAITATYRGSTSYTASVSAPAPSTVTTAPASVAVAASVASPTLGQSVTLSATVTSPPPGAGTPRGTVAFYDGATLLGTRSLSTAGTASLTTTNLGFGARSVTVAYLGSATYAPATSDALALEVGPAVTTVTLRSSANPVLINRNVTYTAVVRAAQGTPTGSVRFVEDGVVVATVPLSDTGRATLARSYTEGANLTIVAEYVPTGTFAPANAELAQAVVTTPVTLTFVTDRNPAVQGETITYTANVTAATGSPTGHVLIYDGSILIETIDYTGTPVEYRNNGLTVGTHTVKALFIPTPGTDYPRATRTIIQVIEPPAP